MDERYLLGIGNGYSDEILWEARLHPRQPAGSLAPEEWTRLAQAMHRVLEAAISAGGETRLPRPIRCPRALRAPRPPSRRRPVPALRAALAALVAGSRETDYCPACQAL